MFTTLGTIPVAPNSIAPLARLLVLVRIAAFRSLKVRYRGTFLGVLWSFGNPVMMTGVYTALFGTAFSQYYDHSIVRYVFAVFIGLVVVTFFTGTTSEAIGTIVANGSMLNKVPVPSAVFPLSAVAANAFQHALTTFPVVLAFSIFIARDPIRALLVPVVLAGLILLTTGFALALASLYVFFRDLSYLWGVTGFVLWMTSPMFYPEALVQPRIRIWFEINPVAQSISALREVALGYGPINYHPIAYALGSGIVACVLAVGLFRSTSREFMDLI